MRHRWTLRTSTPDAWLIAYGPHVVAELIWIRDLAHPTLTMARIEDGLNGLHQGTPPRAWTLGPEALPGRHDICHHSELVAELAWTRTITNPERWLARLLEGLNWRSNARGHQPSTTIPTGRPDLRSVS